MDISDMYKHLSNYSIQKTAAKSENSIKDDLTMSQEQFLEYLANENGQDGIAGHALMS